MRGLEKVKENISVIFFYGKIGNTEIRKYIMRNTFDKEKHHEKHIW